MVNFRCCVKKKFIKKELSVGEIAELVRAYYLIADAIGLEFGPCLNH